MCSWNLLNILPVTIIIFSGMTVVLHWLRQESSYWELYTLKSYLFVLERILFLHFGSFNNPFWWRLISGRNQSIDLHSKLIAWFLCDVIFHGGIFLTSCNIQWFFSLVLSKLFNYLIFFMYVKILLAIIVNCNM